MSYELFCHLVRTQATLQRSLARPRPGRDVVIGRAIAAINARLRACERYDGYLRHMAARAAAPIR